MRGAKHQAELTIASRFGRHAPVQRWFARSSVATALEWCAPPVDPVAELHAAEHSVWSQQGEDGLLEALLERTGGPARTFVEIGASDGIENCTRALAERGGRGFWFEADTARVQRASEVTSDLAVQVHRATVTAENVVALLTESGVPSEPDVLVLDIDGNDFWVLRSILREFAPRVLVAEYNATFPPGEFWTRRRRAYTQWDDTYRHGASLDALDWVCRHAGYRLVACLSHGVNAFFVRDDLADEVGLRPHPIASLYRAVMVARPMIGHPYNVDDDCPLLDADDRQRLEIRDAAIIGRRPRSDHASSGLVGVLARIRNDTNHWLSSTGPTPLHLSAHLLDARGNVVEFETERNWIHGGIRPHGDAWAGGIFGITDPHARTLRLCLVQDGVAWLDSSALDITLEECSRDRVH